MFLKLENSVLLPKIIIYGNVTVWEVHWGYLGDMWVIEGIELGVVVWI